MPKGILVNRKVHSESSVRRKVRKTFTDISQFTTPKVLSFFLLSDKRNKEAGNAIRTRDILVGNEMLYH